MLLFMMSGIYLHRESLKMPRGLELNGIQRGQVDVLFENATSIKAIARQLEKSPKCIRNYLQNRHLPKVKRCGRPKLLSERDERRINNEASIFGTRSHAIRKRFELPVSTKTVLRVLQANPNLVHKKMLLRQAMTAAHRQARVAWCLPETRMGGRVAQLGVHGRKEV